MRAKVKRLMHLRDKAHRVAKEQDCPSLWKTFRETRNLAVAELRKAKLAFYTKLSSNLSSPKDFWSTYRSISREFHQVPQVLYAGNDSASSSSGKASLLNLQFASNFAPKSTSAVPPASPEDAPCLSSLECSPFDVLLLLSRLRTDVATGPDGISSKVLRHCASSISSHFSYLFNLSISKGIVPVDWKTSNITPIFKSGDGSLASN